MELSKLGNLYLLVIRDAAKLPHTTSLSIHSFQFCSNNSVTFTNMKPPTLSVLYLIHLTSLLLILAESTQPPFSCDTSDPRTKSYLFCKTTLPITQRAQDLVSRLTLDEKLSQLVNSASPIPRLGIPAYQWWSEALHGVAYSLRVTQGIRFNGTIQSATSFPQVILTAACFDAHLWYRIAQAIYYCFQAVGIEARAIYNAGQATGMTFWAPNINIYRDPRWGRGQETPGEDPLGYKGDSFEGGKLGQHLQASACCKHFTAYDLDNWKGVKRYVFNAKVSLQDLADTYQPPFQSCIQQGKASGIMCAYNRVNGVPNSAADYNLLSKTARGQWGFNGYITSDCDAVAIIHEDQGYGKLPEDAVADVLKAGMDVNCGTYLKKYTKSAVEKRKLPVSEIDRALHNLFSVRMRLGLFDGNPVTQPYGTIGSDKVLIGPNANSAKTLVGNYAGPPCKPVTPLQGLQSYVKDTRFHQGCNGIAKGADHVVLVMGLDQTQESEDHDRVDLLLPPKQQKLISSIARVAKNPVILVLLSGGPVDISFAKNDQRIGSILWTGYPGEAGGRALAEIIFGDHNPGGRLPVTWYPQSYVNVPMTDMRMRPEPSSSYPGRTYRFYQGPKAFEFGYGLSYSNYTYEILPRSNPNRDMPFSEMGAEACEKMKYTVKVRVKNHGEMAGKHPMLLFVRQPKMVNGRPVKQLVAFQSVNLNAGERAEVEFELRPCEHLSSAKKDGSMVIEEGSYLLSIEDKESEIQVVK
ncbi:hypothetical protein ES288_A02G091400v1 [Gossypium darwinii]|uniref:Fibronectin type III-like domain-containing protein n=1 Tax=Gossypium darwinii TaxID=34276 RepID=A0A5D2HC28_GOSDA|nr:hypothetical protein ES288_A02G091400v1 [Gossypium darwinii]